MRKARKTEAARKPSHEIEVKLHVPDRPALLARLDELGATYEGRVHEMNTIYDTRDRSLVRKGQLLRLRIERRADHPGANASNTGQKREGALLTFKGPIRRSDSPAARSHRKYKVREEREVRAADGDELAIILEALGLIPSFRYEKYRSTYRLSNLEDVLLELDETPVGDFLEVEGARESIDRAAKLLGYQPSDYMTKSYWDLFQESRNSGETKSAKRKRVPNSSRRDMLFSSKP
jgi:adenylate cyclase class 2